MSLSTATEGRYSLIDTSPGAADGSMEGEGSIIAEAMHASLPLSTTPKSARRASRWGGKRTSKDGEAVKREFAEIARRGSASKASERYQQRSSKQREDEVVELSSQPSPPSLSLSELQKPKNHPAESHQPPPIPLQRTPQNLESSSKRPPNVTPAPVALRGQRISLPTTLATLATPAASESGARYSHQHDRGFEQHQSSGSTWGNLSSSIRAENQVQLSPLPYVALEDLSPTPPPPHDQGTDLVLGARHVGVSASLRGGVSLGPLLLKGFFSAWKNWLFFHLSSQQATFAESAWGLATRRTARRSFVSWARLSFSRAVFLTQAFRVAAFEILPRRKVALMHCVVQGFSENLQERKCRRMITVTKGAYATRGKIVSSLRLWLRRSALTQAYREMRERHVASREALAKLTVFRMLQLHLIMNGDKRSREARARSRIAMHGTNVERAWQSSSQCDIPSSSILVRTPSAQSNCGRGRAAEQRNDDDDLPGMSGDEADGKRGHLDDAAQGARFNSSSAMQPPSRKPAKSNRGGDLPGDSDSDGDSEFVRSRASTKAAVMHRQRRDEVNSMSAAQKGLDAIDTRIASWEGNLLALEDVDKKCGQGGAAVRFWGDGANVGDLHSVEQAADLQRINLDIDAGISRAAIQQLVLGHAEQSREPLTGLENLQILRGAQIELPCEGPFEFRDERGDDSGEREAGHVSPCDQHDGDDSGDVSDTETALKALFRPRRGSHKSETMESDCQSTLSIVNNIYRLRSVTDRAETKGQSEADISLDSHVPRRSAAISLDPTCTSNSGKRGVERGAETQVLFQLLEQLQADGEGKVSTSSFGGAPRCQPLDATTGILSAHIKIDTQV